MLLDGIGDTCPLPSLVETNLPWREHSDVVSISQSRSHDDVPCTFIDKTEAQTTDIPVILTHSILTEEDKPDFCGLSELPWRCKLHEVPSLSVMCSEGTCPSFYDTENSHHLEMVHIPSKFDFNCDNDVSMGYNSQEDDRLAFSTADLSLSDERGSKNESCLPKRHCFPPRHKSYHQHLCQQQSNRSCNHQPGPVPRFVLECDDWEEEDEAAWGNLETRVWSWLDQVDNATSCVDTHDESLDTELLADDSNMDIAMSDPSYSD